MSSEPSPANPAFKRTGPAVPASPVVLSVPHAGRSYSERLLKAARLPRSALELLEDRLVDQLVWRATAAGATALIALAPRAEIDLNRELGELDPAMIVGNPMTGLSHPSARTRGGLGLIPSRIPGAGAIWHQRLPAAELQRRISTIHQPYHAALAEALLQARERFGVAILLDCHSMPPREGSEDAKIVLGDRYGTTIARRFVEAAAGMLARAGTPPAFNDPYAGGFITARHGRPAEGLHALQIEIDRSLYLAPDLRSPGPGFDQVTKLVAAVVGALAEKALETPLALAAE